MSPRTSSPPTRQTLQHPHPLQTCVEPHHVVVIGASDNPNRVGHAVLANLRTSFTAGSVMALNPNHSTIQGQPAYGKLADLPHRPDLAIIATPADSVPDLVENCAQYGIPSVVVLSAGFAEIGAEGLSRQAALKQVIENHPIRVIGPNCLGVMNPAHGLNATFARHIAAEGSVAFISQSGALCTAVLDWSLHAGVGFSKFVSTGSMVDVDWATWLEFLGQDPQTHSIFLYMESLATAPDSKQAERFFEVAHQVSLAKPIVVLKPGKSKAAARAAHSHTGAMATEDRVLAAAFEQAGLLRVETLAELYNLMQVLALKPVLPAHPHLTIVTNAGGPGVLATDTFTAAGGQMTTLPQALTLLLNECLPAHWSHHNPIDILGDAPLTRFQTALGHVLSHTSECDGILVLLTPQAILDPMDAARGLVNEYKKHSPRPILTCWMGGQDMNQARLWLNQQGLPSLAFPDQAAQVMNQLHRFYCAQHHHGDRRQLHQALPPLEAHLSNTKMIKQAQQYLDQLQSSLNQTGTLTASAYEALHLLSYYDLSQAPMTLVQSSSQAIKVADELGYPVVLKLHSNSLTHKSDVGGVHLNLHTPQAVQAAFEAIEQTVLSRYAASTFEGVTVEPMITVHGVELLLGAHRDPVFGPIVTLGEGGVLTQFRHDTALGFAPLSEGEAMALIEKTAIARLLKGFRHYEPCNLQELTQFISRFSLILSHHPNLLELEINPLLVTPQKIHVMDARLAFSASAAVSLNGG